MYSVASLLRTPLGPHYLSLIHVQCSLFIKDTIGSTLPVLNTEVPSFQRYFCIGLYQLGHYKCPHYKGVHIIEATLYIIIVHILNTCVHVHSYMHHSCVCYLSYIKLSCSFGVGSVRRRRHASLHVLCIYVISSTAMIRIIFI